MKKIILVRHAKSSWEHNVIDHERPLNNRGLNDTNLISSKLLEDKLDLDLVLSSDAMRAKTTANIFVSNLNIDKDIFYLNHDLYDFSGSNLTMVIKACDDSINNLMIFGHNHAITAFVNTFGDLYIDNVPTCGVTIIDFDIESWSDLKQGETIKTLFPRDLK
ncbi:phosphohistidine phosphatase [Flaviramulus basaltis]|uniref:Phosphohistidine phosphatase n=1 Tax=Flaviramulus basaltis TaxID=369401 RepID=A0A1K2IGW4_9FLAO|nr:histidine phosphatase family protein [Flaviramulus basaltis]SFZ91472.1 phosphohistidine phosphatase [Flaviramulus basaltis]